MAYHPSHALLSVMPDIDWPRLAAVDRNRTRLIDLETGRQYVIEPEDAWRVDPSRLHTGHDDVSVMLDHDGTTAEGDQ